MYTKKQPVFKRTLILLLTFAGGILTTLFASAVYDANIENRANTIFSTLKSNAGNMDPLDVSSYYTLVRMNIKSLMQVLTLVDENIAREQSKIPGFDDTSILSGITSTGTTPTAPTNPTVPVVPPTVPATPTTPTPPPKCETGSKWNGSICVVDIKISPSIGVFDIARQNTLTAEIVGVTKENTLICTEILAHPTYATTAVNTGYCTNSEHFLPFIGNNEWVYRDNKWIGTMPYNSATYGIAGIRTRTFWKDKNSQAVTTYDISVTGAPVYVPPPAPEPFIRLSIMGLGATSQGYLPVKVGTTLNIDYNVMGMRQCSAWYSQAGGSAGREVNFTGINRDGSTWVGNHTETDPGKGSFLLKIEYPTTLVFNCSGFDNKAYSETLVFQVKIHDDTDTFIEVNKETISQAGESVSINWQTHPSTLSVAAQYCHISRTHSINGAKGSPTIFLEKTIDITSRNSGNITDSIDTQGQYVYVLNCNNNSDVVADVYNGSTITSKAVIFIP